MKSFPALKQEQAHINWGGSFEQLLISHLSIKCTLRDDIQDFKLIINAKDHGSLDDIVIQIDLKNGEKEVIVCQLKYKKNKASVPEFRNLEKYEESYHEIQEKYGSNTKIRAILYTNTNLTNPEDFEVKQMKFLEQRLLSIFNTNGEAGKSYQIVKKNNKSKFYKNCFLFSNQIEPKFGDELLLKDLENSFDRTQIALIKNYFENTSKNTKFYSKPPISFVLRDILLNPIMYTNEIRIMQHLFNNTLIVETFNNLKLSRISKNYCHYLFQSIVEFIENNILNSKLPNYDCEDEIPDDKLKRLITDEQLNLFIEIKRKYNEINTKDLLFLYWTTGKIPLLLNCLNSKTQKSIAFYRKYLSNGVSAVLITEFKMQGVYNNLTTVNSKLLKKIGNTNIQLQFQNAKLNRFINKHIKFIRQIDTDSFLKLFSEHVNISSVSEKLDFYIDRELKTENNMLITEKELFYCSNEQCKIIHGVAGIGKTTFLQNQVLKDAIKIYCNINTNKMPEFTGYKSILTYIADIFNSTNKDKNFKPFITKLITKAFDSKKLFLLFDGYDESNENPDKFLRITKISKIPFLIATRSAKLKTEINAQIYELKKLKTTGLKQFITEYCKRKNIDSSLIINIIISKLSKTLLLNIFGNPSLTKNAINICSNIDINQKLTLFDLFENCLEKHMETQNESILRRRIESLASSVFFDNDILEKLNIDADDLKEALNDFKSKHKKDEIISSVSATNELQFTHRTYAGFLCARYLNRVFLKSKNLFQYRQIIELLYSEQVIQVRYFFDLLSTKGKPLHTAILFNDENEVFKILEKNETGLSDLSEGDKYERTVLHIIMGYGNRYNYPYIVNGLKQINKSVHNNSHETDKQFAVNGNILVKILNCKSVKHSNDSFGNYPCKYGFYSRSYEFLDKYLNIYDVGDVPDINKSICFIYFIDHHNFSTLLQKCLK